MRMALAAVLLVAVLVLAVLVLVEVLALAVPRHRRLAALAVALVALVRQLHP